MKDMKMVNWTSSPYLHFIHLDYVPGELCSDTETCNEMWGGLALAVMFPEKRKYPDLVIEEKCNLYNAAFHHSLYYKPLSGNFVRRLFSKLKT